MRKAVLALFTLTGACSSTNAAPPSNGYAADAAASGLADASTGSTPDAGLQRLNHVVVIVLENWSFDSLYAEFTGAEGLAGALAAPPQVDPTTGQPYATLPQTESHMPAGLPNEPFALDAYLSVAVDTSIDLTTNFYAEQQQIDDGKMDLFVATERRQGAHDGLLPHGRSAPRDRSQDVHALRSLLSWSLRRLVAEPHFPHLGGRREFPERAPTRLSRPRRQRQSREDPDSGALKNGPLTPDGYVVGTLFPANTPHPATAPPPAAPPQDLPTIGDSLSAKGVDWAWYAGGWNDATRRGRRRRGADFQYHHQPFVYFANYAEGTPGGGASERRSRLRRGRPGRDPARRFFREACRRRQRTPELHRRDHGRGPHRGLINAVRNGPNWGDTVIVVTYDESGGFWDHVPPPVVDRGALARACRRSSSRRLQGRGMSIRRSTTRLDYRADRAPLGTRPLGTRDANAADLANAFDLAQ